MNSGKQNEIDILSALTGKKFKDLEENWQKHVRKMFPSIKEEDVIHAFFYQDGYAKPDIVVSVNEKSKLLSVKSGKNPSCHLESFEEFSMFLANLGVPQRIIKIIHFFKFKIRVNITKHFLSNNS